MFDQYGKEVPQDLVVLPFGAAPGEDVIGFDPVDPEDVEIICAADWYEVEGQEGLILASYEAINGFGSIPLDCGIDLQAPGVQINRIVDRLKQYSLKDGFYHV
jgi:hypothetical protein